MDAQRTPEQITQNELICEKLLGWRLLGRSGSCDTIWSLPNGRDGRQGTPSFTTWAEAGLILEALPKEHEYVVGYCDIDKQWYCGQAVGSDTYALTGPLAIRAAALEYIKAVKS